MCAVEHSLKFIILCSVLWTFGSPGLCVALTRSAGAAIVESDETAWELSNWTAAAGSVDHFMPAEGVADPVPNDFDGDAIPDLLVHDTVAGEVRVTLSTSPEPVWSGETSRAGLVSCGA